jgi:hypothetical protein
LPLTGFTVFKSLAKAVTVAVHFQQMAMVGEPVDQRAVMAASLKMVSHCSKGRLVVTISDLRSYRLAKMENRSLAPLSSRDQQKKRRKTNPLLILALETLDKTNSQDAMPKKPHLRLNLTDPA